MINSFPYIVLDDFDGSFDPSIENDGCGFLGFPISILFWLHCATFSTLRAYWISL